MVKEKGKYSYDRFESKGQRVGQAVMDILKDPEEYQVEEILEELGKDWLDLIRQRAEEGKGKLQSPFYVLSLMKKALGQFGVANVLTHSARSFQTEFSMEKVMSAHPNATKTMFKIDTKAGEISLLWTVPGWEECRSVMKNPQIYDPQLVNWVSSCVSSSGKSA